MYYLDDTSTRKYENVRLVFIFVFKQSYCKKQKCICIHYVMSLCLYLLMPVDFLAINYYIVSQ